MLPEPPVINPHLGRPRLRREKANANAPEMLRPGTSRLSVSVGVHCNLVANAHCGHAMVVRKG